MADLYRIEEYASRLLDSGRFSDWCPNGLQVDGGRREVRRLVTGVTASLALIEAAAESGADLLLVHHGWFWKGEPLPLTGVKGRRVRTLLKAGMSLLAYHLPLDAHPQFGNNRQLGERLGLEDAAPVDERGLLWSGRLPEPAGVEPFAARIESALGRIPLHLAGGPPSIRRVGWCTGGAHAEVERAAALGLDAFVTGEPAEQSRHLAQELAIHFFAAGHHATERFGVQSLGDHLAAHFDLEHRYIEIPNPV